MKYHNIKKAIFLSRPNRFIAHVELNGRVEVAHVKNTGRCKELLVPGAVLLLQEFDNPNRKTKFDVIGVYKGQRLINMDSQIPNKIVAEWLNKGNLIPNILSLRPEATYGNSRFDFYMEAAGDPAGMPAESEGSRRRIFIEVKGVTLEQDGVALFPDAPTQRGVKHIYELIDCLDHGYEAYLIFIIQMKDIRYFTPNDQTHPAFGAALREAQDKGVQVLALDCQVGEDSIEAVDRVPIFL